MLLDLTRRYQEPHRHYHTLEHIAAMLHEGRRFPLDEEQQMAVWFHDAVYEPGSPHNEQKSARLAAKWLVRSGWETDAVDRVCRIVLDTKAHVPTFNASTRVSPGASEMLCHVGACPSADSETRSTSALAGAITSSTPSGSGTA